MFIFEKRIADKLHKPKRKETVTELLKASVKQLERFRHPKVSITVEPLNKTTTKNYCENFN